MGTLVLVFFQPMWLVSSVEELVHLHCHSQVTVRTAARWQEMVRHTRNRRNL
jgi:hypothetical protein